jgi:hypothetical protein
MPQYLLRIKKRKWDKLNLPWLEPNQIQADPLGDLNISEGTLSVWHIEDDKSNLDLVIAALAVNRQNFDKFEYGLFDQKIVDSIKLKIQIVPGDTPIDNVNSWHRDLVELTVDKASSLVKAIFDNFDKQRLLVDDVKTKIINAAKEGSINLQNVKDPTMKNEIIRLLND